MTTIVLLDSDTSALDVLAPAMAALRPEWVVHPVTTGQQALQLIRDESVDVVITETRLSDTSGFELLDQTRSTDETVIRFTLSDDLEAEVVLESARANHRFIAKPVETDHLIASIEGSMKLRTLLLDEPLQAQMREVTSIPALPAIYDEMMQELAAPHSSLVKVGEIVESDTGLTITVLKIVNSAFYGLNRRVESVAQAVTLLGVHLIKNITLTAKVFSKFEGSALSLRRLTELNDEAIRMGALSNQFARYAKLSKGIVDHCQIAGMLCNVGELIATTKTEDSAEQSPVSKNVLGAYLLRSWMMPDAVVEAVALQRESPPQHAQSISPLVVLHSIRYLQEHHTDTTDAEQRQHCLEYLSHYIPEYIADIWLDAFQALEQLTSAESQKAA